MAQYKGAIIVPMTHDDADFVLDALRDAFANQFGGYSVYKGSGGWVAPDGEQYEERHARIEAVGMSEDGFTGEWFRKQARHVKDQLEQESVMVEIQETDSFMV